MRPLSLSRGAGYALVIRAAVLCAVGDLLLGGEARAQTDVLWRRTVSRPVQFTRLSATGDLLVVTDSGITALDPDSGSQVWRYPAREPFSVFRQVSTGHLLVGGGRVLAALELETGEAAWRRTDLPDLKKTSVITDRRDSIAILQTRAGFAVLDLTSGVTAWDSTALTPGTVVREYFRFRSLNMLLLIARTPASAFTLMGVTLDSGTVRWSSSTLLQSDVKFKRDGGVEYAYALPPVTLPDSTVVLYLTTEGPLRLDPRSGELLWQSSSLAGTTVPAFEDGYPRIRLLDSLLIVPSRNRLVALEIATGQARWSTMGVFPDRPTWLVVDSSAIVTGSFGGLHSFVSILRTDGLRRRPTDWLLDAKARGLLLRDTLYLSNEGQLYAVPLDTGLERKLAPIIFQGDESPLEIDSLDGGGLVLMGQQNLARINRDGSIVYQRYYPAPARSFWTMDVNARNYAWSAKALDYFYILTAKPDATGQKGFSLVVLDRRNGRELGRMWFDERNPFFLLDGRSGTVYEVEGKSEIIARRFPGLPPIGLE